MSAKKYFEKQKENIIKLKGFNKKGQSALSEVESPKFVEEFFEEKDTFLPDVDYSDPANFVYYGSAKVYYDNAFLRVRTQYPYDGSQAEKLEFYNSLTPLEQYVYNEQYPKSTGYVEFGVPSGSWSPTGAPIANFGPTNTPQYIRFYGGPHDGNIIDDDKNQQNNLEFFYSHGVTVEFWMKKDEWVDVNSSSYEAIFNLRNDQDSQRFFIYLDQTTPAQVWIYHENLDLPSVEAHLGLNTGLTTIADSEWHHYAIAMSNVSATANRFKLFVDGQCADDAEDTGLGAFAITGSLVATLGGAGGLSGGGVPTPAAIYDSRAGNGKLSGSIDDFRFWKNTRTSKEIGLNYFRPIAGGTNTDISKYYYSSSLDNSPVNLGVYLKFNEGITGIDTTDSIVLDYSGRDSNGAFVGYTGSLDMRNTGSAMVLSSVATAENPEPILYSTNPLYSTRLTSLQTSGSHYDFSNNSYLYNMLPRWIRADDEDAGLETKALLQIVGSYFDTLHGQVAEITRLREKKYPTLDNKQNDIGHKLLTSYGFDVSELFIDSEVLQMIFAQDEKKVFSDKLYNLKNKIYKNIYNNLTHIYKTKGSEKAFRNLFRCFGTDDELFKINLYGDKVEYEIKDNPFETYTKKQAIDFSGLATASADNRNAVIFQYYDGVGPQYGYYPSSSNADIPFTAEAEILFPKMPELAKFSALSLDTRASLFGVHSSSLSHTDTTTAGDSPPVSDAGFQVYSVKEKVGAYFLLTSSNSFFPTLTSSVFQTENDAVYDNLRWNLAVRIRPDKYPWTSVVTASQSASYEFYGTKVHLGETLAEFSVSASLTLATASQFLTASNKRFYIGADRTNITGALLTPSDVRFSRFMVWEDYITDDEIKRHARDPTNYGRTNPHENMFVFETPASDIYIPRADALALNWEFSTLSTASAAGTASNVLDSTSGSNILAQRYLASDYSNIVGRNYVGEGRFFGASEHAAIRDFLPTQRIQAPDILYTNDMVQVLDQDDAEIIKFKQPAKHFFAVEASMYEVISRFLLQFFDSVIAYNNLIGEPVNHYRPSYKNIDYLRRLLFDKIEQVDRLDKFVALYKFLDNALDSVLSNMIPASAGAAEQVRTIVESHVLERNKWRAPVNFLIQNIGGVPGSDYPEAAAAANVQDPKSNSEKPFDAANVDTAGLKGISANSTITNVQDLSLAGDMQNYIGGAPIENSAKGLSISSHELAGANLVSKQMQLRVFRKYQDVKQITSTPADGIRGHANIVGLLEYDRGSELVGVESVDTARAQITALNKRYTFARDRAIPYTLHGTIELRENEGKLDDRIETQKLGNITNFYSDIAQDGVALALQELPSNAAGTPAPLTKYQFQTDIYGLRKYQLDAAARAPTVDIAPHGNRYLGALGISVLDGTSSMPGTIAPNGANKDFQVSIVRSNNRLKSPFIEGINSYLLVSESTERPENWNFGWNVDATTNEPDFFLLSPQGRTAFAAGGAVTFDSAHPTNLVQTRKVSYNTKYIEGKNWNGDPMVYIQTGMPTMDVRSLLISGGVSASHTLSPTFENLNSAFPIPDIVVRNRAPSTKDGSVIYVRNTAIMTHRRDFETEQYSANNTLNYANPRLRQALNKAIATPLILAASPASRRVGVGTKAMHSAPPNPRYRINPLTSSLEITYDNGFLQNDTPQNNFIYQWIRKASLLRFSSYNGVPYVPARFSADIPNILEYTPLFTTLCNSEIKTLSGSENTITTTAFGEQFADFVGLNTWIYESFNTSSNLLSGDANDYLNENVTTIESPAASRLNAILLNRNGPYGWSCWKQTHNHDTPGMRALRNRMSFLVTAPNTYPRLHPRPSEADYYSFDYSPMGTKNTSNFIYMSMTPQGEIIKVPYSFDLGITEIYDTNREEFINLRKSNVGLKPYNYSDSLFSKIVDKTDAPFAESVVYYYDYGEYVFPRLQEQYTLETVAFNTYDSLVNWPQKLAERLEAMTINSCGNVLQTPEINLREGQSSWPLETAAINPVGALVNIRSGEGVVPNTDLAIVEASPTTAGVPFGNTTYVQNSYGFNVKYNTVPDSQIFNSERRAYLADDEYTYERSTAQGRGIVAEYRESDFVDSLIGDANADTNLTVYGRSGSLQQILSKYSYSDQMFEVDLPLKKSTEFGKVNITLETEAQISLLPYENFYPIKQLFNRVLSEVDTDLTENCLLSGADQTPQTLQTKISTIYAKFLQTGILQPVTAMITDGGYANAFANPIDGPSASNNLDYILPEASYDDAYLPYIIRDSHNGFAAPDSTASLGISRVSGSFNYTTQTSRLAQQFIVECEKMYGIQSPHFTGREPDSCDSGSQGLYNITEQLSGSGGVRNFVMYITLEKPHGNNSTIGDLRGPWPYVGDLCCDEGFGSILNYHEFFDASTVWTYESNGSDPIPPDWSYAGDAGVLKFVYTPVNTDISVNVTAQEVLWGSNTQITYYKKSIASVFGTADTVFQGMDLRDLLVFDYGPKNELIVDLKATNLSALLNTTGSETSGRAGSDDIYNHAAIGIAPYVTGTMKGTSVGRFLAIYGPEWARAHEGGVSRPPGVPEFGSLANILGLRGRHHVGDIEQNVSLTEGLVAIPISTKDCAKTDFFYVDEEKFWRTLLYLDLKGQLKYKYFSQKELEKWHAIQKLNDLDETETAMADSIAHKETYKYPPELDELKQIRADIQKGTIRLRNGKLESEGVLKPYISFGFEFFHSLSIEDRLKIWQGVNPEKAPEKLTQKITFDARKVFGDNIPDNMRLMIFKVKKRAEYNIDDYRARKYGKKEYREIDDDVSYNWPYDDYTIIRYAKVKAKLAAGAAHQDGCPYPHDHCCCCPEELPTRPAAGAPTSEKTRPAARAGTGEN